MSNILKSEDFGLKIYNRFPFKYREDDEKQNYALKNYLLSLSDGGFKYCIDEINGILNLVDPNKVDSKVLPVLLQQYGLEVFNGIPETYLRYLLPKLSEAWSKKGSIDVIDFMTSSLSGIKSSTEVTYTYVDGYGNIINKDPDNPNIDIRLEVDYNTSIPDTEQLKRILTNFVPFYADLRLIYSYMFYEKNILTLKELSDTIMITDTKDDMANLSTAECDYDRSLVKIGVVEDSPKFWNLDLNATTNNMMSTLNGSLITNSLVSYDKVTINGNTEIVY